ncbi:MAG: type toxin-antitoxin system RelE/ParE family toxin [Devosia sp.]|uniref:type II toxin-antitoxin system RelE/ParE family toxin n=1 Tax=Devosia sp. TaxID=1871048 RepID=UPI0026358CD5|nr:type II toxin-antitoxin system RelE/ParE family toxin [Devosia sp.]MDB5586004.1 type toxin-antitoxin system RelE/ParE family toxin [Devosia sp.]
MRLKFSQAARRDLRSIFIQSARKFGLQQAETYRDGLLASLAFVAERPFAVPEYRNSKRTVRVHRHQSHVVIFEVREDEVLIARVVHGLRDINRLL